MMSASPTIFYSWSPPTGLNTTSGQFVSASPTTVTNYTVTAMNGSCAGTGTITITPLPTPTLSAAFTNSVICAGDPTTLNVSGATSYTISPYAPFATPYYVLSTTQYTINGMNSFGCSSKIYPTVFVNPAPVIFTNASPSLACMGQTVALTFNGTGTSYTFNTVPLSGNTVVVSPTVNTTYTIAATTSQGCTGWTAYTLYVGCVGINGPILTETKGLSVYPNPSAGQFNLSSGKNEAVRIVNELGQLIKHFELKADAPLMISDLSPGVYFVMSADTRIKIIVLQ